MVIIVKYSDNTTINNNKISIIFLIIVSPSKSCTPRGKQTDNKGDIYNHEIVFVYVVIQLTTTYRINRARDSS